MGSFTSEMEQLIFRYRTEVFPDKYKDLTMEKLAYEPHHEKVWTHWEAMAHYKINNRHFFNLEDAPNLPEGSSVFVIGQDTSIQYRRKNGEWVIYQSMTRDDCKAIYGK